MGGYFDQDVSKEDIAVVAATQVPTFSGVFDDWLSQAAYETKPSWFVSPKADGAIPPEVKKAMATAIGARLTELDGSHVIMWSKPREVANVIIETREIGAVIQAVYAPMVAHSPGRASSSPRADKGGPPELVRRRGLLRERVCCLHDRSANAPWAI